MKKKHNPKIRPFGIIIAVLLLVFGVYFITNKTKNSEFKNYTSEALKTSFQYPKDWYIDDRYQKILISNYQTNLNQNNQPKSNEIAIVLSQASLCQKTLDLDVSLGGCGEGQNSKNEVLSKNTKELAGGSFIIYKIKYPTGQEAIFYYVQKGDKTLQISKKPDPSQFEKEFETIINSIEFK